MIRLSKANFRRWLVENDGKIVGDPTETNTCPLCRFLKSYGAKKVNMNFSVRIVDGKSHQNIGWTRKFQRDAISLQHSFKVEGLRGREALRVLDSV